MFPIKTFVSERRATNLLDTGSLAQRWLSPH